MKIFNQGEIRELGIEVYSTAKEAFVIDTAEYEIQDKEGKVVDSGKATIEDHIITIIYSMLTKGSYVCYFKYTVGSELFKSPIHFEIR